ncbi:MAG: hypothetical protein CBB92_12895 [Flammeovirgaceae bacterium TMED32]|nr:MAG: hypothetical protein CBB92_12895 [Flammeovirgaceae bacterium TMED32]|tara:strand:- start:4542 stop:5471 length:930 start_codon:yes stop_codon:yes gene_type:complete
MKKIFILLIAFAFFACENIIYPELEPSLEQYVVDAWLNDLPGSQKIFLSKSNNYFMSELPKLLSGAKVYLTDEDGNRYDFEETEGGYVWGDSLSTSFLQVGTSYQLNVSIDGIRFSGTSEMNPVPPIDSITFKYQEEDFSTAEDYYLAEVVATDLAGVGNTYWIKAWKNGVYLNKASEINIAYDAGFSAGGNIDGQVFIQPIQELINPFDTDEEPPYSIGDTIYVEIYSISESAFYFLNEVKIQTVRSGGFGALFAQPFSNVSTNLMNEDVNSAIHPVGFFNVSAISSLEQVLTSEIAQKAQEEAENKN